MNRSTNNAPESLSTSYLIGSAFIGISITTLKSSGRLRPGGTRSRLMVFLGEIVVRRPVHWRLRRALRIGTRLLCQFGESQRCFAKMHRRFAALVGLFGQSRKSERRGRMHTKTQALQQIRACLAPQLFAHAE